MVFWSVSLYLKRYLNFSFNILFCTAGESLYECAYNFEHRMKQLNYYNSFKEEPKMNGGCYAAFQLGRRGGGRGGRGSLTYCFCDSYDGCNSAGVTQLSLFLFGFIVLTGFAF